MWVQSLKISQTHRKELLFLVSIHVYPGHTNKMSQLFFTFFSKGINCGKLGQSDKHMEIKLRTPLNQRQQLNYFHLDRDERIFNTISILLLFY